MGTDAPPLPDSFSWRLVLIGVIAGFTAGLFGVGGGIVIVPALVFIAGFPQKLASGTSLTAIVPISLSGIIGYATQGEVDWTAAALVAAGALVGTVVGTRLLVRISTPALQITFAVVMGLTAIKMLFEEGDAAGRADLTVAMAVGMLLVGAAAGLVAGLLGVGGGTVIVPALSLVFGLPHVLAKGTSLAVILPTAAFGTFRNRRSGFTMLGAAATVGLAGIVAALGASQLALDLDPTLSRGLFAALMVVAGARLAYAGWTGRDRPVTDPTPVVAD